MNSHFPDLRANSEKITCCRLENVKKVKKVVEFIWEKKGNCVWNLFLQWVKIWGNGVD